MTNTFRVSRILQFISRYLKAGEVIVQNAKGGIYLGVVRVTLNGANLKCLEIPTSNSAIECYW